MSQHYTDYVWKQGLPYGINTASSTENITYKIVSDPYHKRNSIERYVDGNFKDVVYDSALFDFRQLKLGEQLSWQKTSVAETENTAICHIRNQDDRLVLIEKYTFIKDRCKECHAFSPQGIPISVQKIYYTALNDPFNGVVLFDANDHPVMLKKYKIDEASGEFSDLLEEEWDGQKCGI